MAVKKRFLCMLIVISMLLGINPGVVKAYEYDDDYDEDYAYVGDLSTYSVDSFECSNYDFKYDGVCVGIGQIALNDHITLYARKKGTKKWTLVSDDLKMEVSKNSSRYGMSVSRDGKYKTDSIYVYLTGLEPVTIYEFKVYSEILDDYTDIFSAYTCFKPVKCKIKGNKITWKKIPNADGYEVGYNKHWSYNEGFVEKDKWIEVKCKKTVTSYTVKIKDKKHITINEARVIPYKILGNYYVDSISNWHCTKKDKNQIKMKIK